MDSFTLTMWDVKHVWAAPSNLCGIQFYLNYVGCKGGIISWVETIDSVFYLNYVGCKVTHIFDWTRFTIVLP